MFDNIGRKIKWFAKFLTWIGMISSIIIGFILIIDGNDWGILVLLGGPLVSWLSSWLLYAFGELVENSTTIAKHFEEPEHNLQSGNNNTYNSNIEDIDQ